MSEKLARFERLVAMDFDNCDKERHDLREYFAGLEHKLEIGQAQFTEMQSEILRLHEALTQAQNERNHEQVINTHTKAEIANLRQDLTENLELTERIKYASTGDLVTIPRELVLAMEAKLKLYENTLKFISEQTLCTDDKRECVRAAIEALEAAK